MVHTSLSPCFPSLVSIARLASLRFVFHAPTQTPDLIWDSHSVSSCIRVDNVHRVSEWVTVTLRLDRWWPPVPGWTAGVQNGPIPSLPPSWSVLLTDWPPRRRRAGLGVRPQQGGRWALSGSSQSSCWSPSGPEAPCSPSGRRGECHRFIHMNYTINPHIASFIRLSSIEALCSQTAPLSVQQQTLCPVHTLLSLVYFTGRSTSPPSIPLR